MHSYFSLKTYPNRTVVSGSLHRGCQAWAPQPSMQTGKIWCEINMYVKRQNVDPTGTTGIFLYEDLG